jgi:hypothetical protein
MEAVIVGWDAAVDWGSFDGVIVRGAWDYIDDRDGFLWWARSVSSLTRLANPHEVLRWNTDKRYLRELADAGIPVIDTWWSDSGRAESFPEGEFVVKPAVSAGARNSARHTSAETGLAHVQAIVADGGVAMVQPFLPTVETVGETGTYVFGGAVSHAIRKMGVLDAGAAPLAEPSGGSIDRVGPVLVDPDLARFALDVLEASPGPCLYARVDTVPGPDGRPLLMELEVTEPYFFLDRSPGAAAKFAAAAADWLATDPR